MESLNKNYKTKSFSWIWTVLRHCVIFKVYSFKKMIFPNLNSEFGGAEIGSKRELFKG